MNDDLNTAKVVAHLFNILKKINSMQTGQLAPSALGKETFDLLAKTYRTFVTDIMGLREEKVTEVEAVIKSLLELYSQAKSDKNYDVVDQIRASLKTVGVTVKDMKSGISWAYEE